MKNLWDQQVKESSRAFSVFIIYRDQGLRRSCNNVAAQLKMNPSSVMELSKRHKWQERVKAWDSHLDQQTQLEHIESVKIMKQRQISLAIKAQDAAEKGIRKLIAQFGDDSISPYAIKPDGLSKLMEVGCRIERLNRDEPEQKLELAQSSSFDNLTLEECETLRTLIAKAENSQ